MHILEVHFCVKISYKYVDLIDINRSNCLITPPNQFGFKSKDSDAVYTSLVKETISYYEVKMFLVCFLTYLKLLTG